MKVFDLHCDTDVYKRQAKVRPEGVADAQTVEIPSPPKELSTGTHMKLSLIHISGGNFEKFWKIFDERLALCHKALQARHQRLMGTPSDAARCV